MITVVDFWEFCFEKDGNKIKYCQVVLRTQRGYCVKKLSRAFYVDMLENEEYYFDTPFSSVLYDEFGRVAGVNK